MWISKRLRSADWEKSSFLRPLWSKSFLVFFILFTAVLGLTQVHSSENPKHSIEVGFTSLSPAGRSGGEIIPASCASGYVPHFANGDADCDFFSFSVDSSSVPYGGNTYLRWNITENFWNGWGQLQWCRAEGDWSGDKSVRNGVQNTGALTPGSSTKTYLLRCRVMMMEDRQFIEKVKSVSVSVGPQAIPNLSPNPLTINGQGTGGSTPGLPGTHTITFQATDRDGGNIRYLIDWDNNGTIDQYLPSSGYVASGTALSTTRHFPSNANYPFKAYPEDSGGLSTSWTTHTMVISTPNLSPNAPSINGQGNGGSSTNYYPPGTHNFTFYATDRDGGTIRYLIDWDFNGTIDQYLPASGYVASGTALTTSRSFPSVGNFNFRAYTQDSGAGGLSSGWTNHTMQMIPVPCVPNCNRDSQVCQGERYTDANNCAANNCTGTRVCDYNWKEVAP